MLHVQVNWIAVLVAAISTFALGGLWYSPALFGRAWMSASGVTQADLASGNMVNIFGVSFVFSALMALNLAIFLADASTTPTWGR